MVLVLTSATSVSKLKLLQRACVTFAVTSVLAIVNEENHLVTSRLKDLGFTGRQFS